IGYVIDVYRDTIEAEKNFAKILLFTVYFPTLTQGPINRYGDIKGQLFAEHGFSYKNMTFGLKRILWGFFKKLVLAERLAVLVDTTYAGLAAGTYGGAVSLIAMAGFLLQLYFDFSGCIDIVIGASEMFGIVLPENFSHPFASTSVAEFWRRWHVTLGSWLKDYVLFGFTMSGLSKKMSKGLKAKFGRKAATTIISVIGVILVWAVNGPWHGIEPNFLWLAGFFALILVIGAALEPVTKKFNKANARLVSSGGYKFFRAVVTFILVMWGAFFVKGDAFMAAGRLFAANVSPIIIQGSEDLMILGLDIYDFSVLAAGIILWIVVARVSAGAEKKFEEQTKAAAKAAAGNALAADTSGSSAGNVPAGAALTPARRDFRDLMMNWPIVLRWLCLIIMVVAVVLFGMYGDGFEGGSFIYQGF
ncbi:MAG: MBOAT family protein, partial [Parasporobacterium sp.]|nr:MBOAT family protein [Parasporobacterium sp.]